ncbi:MAG: hypothetical protein KGN77_10650 [Xanthomonadaceae bacterium]|nr:hypothetical protein [Xanthomonadaceae bacterium]MDE1964587.1 hypothetical protein [Xanthomonadaceae bacterium]
MSRYRIATLVIVMGGHLGLWLLVMRPPTLWRTPVQGSGRTGSVLELRFVRKPRSIRLGASATLLHGPWHAVLGRGDSPERRRSSQVIPPVPASHPVEAHGASGRIVVRIPDPQATNDAADDGGFAARLHAAQRSNVVHGVPGSDATYAPGIHLIDPMDQGIGAVMRTTRRAFGITSRHCIDVDVWKHLTPGQLAARHISPSDVASAEAKYRCDSPLGLHF